MVTQQLLDYIRALLHKNIKDSEIRDSLARIGWQIADVEAAFDEIRREFAVARAKERHFRIITIILFLYAGVAVFIVAAVFGFRQRSGAVLPGLSPEALELFNSFPGPDTAEEVLRNYSERARRLAVPSQTIEITNCISSPPIFSVDVGSLLTYMNRDPVPRTLRVADYITEENSYVAEEVALEIPAQSAISTTAVSPLTVRFYCDGALAGIGVIQ